MTIRDVCRRAIDEFDTRGRWHGEHYEEALQVIRQIASGELVVLPDAARAEFQRMEDTWRERVARLERPSRPTALVHKEMYDSLQKDLDAANASIERYRSTERANLQEAVRIGKSLDAANAEIARLKAALDSQVDA